MAHCSRRAQQTSWEDTPGTGGDVFIEWEVPALVNAGTSYVLILAGSGWDGHAESK